MDTANVPIACRVTKIDLARVSRGSYRPGTQFAPGVPLQNHLTTRLRDPLQIYQYEYHIQISRLCKTFSKTHVFQRTILYPQYKQFGFCGPEQKLDEGTITAAGYSGKVHFCYPAGNRNTGSVHGNFSVLLAKFVKRGGFKKKVFWGTRFGCIWSGKALRGNAYFSSLIAFDEGERFLFVYRTRSGNRSVCHAISGFGRHLGPAWHTLPRSHVFSFSRPGAGIYFVTLVHR